MPSPRKFASINELASAAGGEIGLSGWLTLTQDMIDAFAEITGDRQWIHIDPERCQRELGTGTIAHGYLVLSLLARFSYEAYSVGGISHAINYGSDRIRYLGPVPAGARLRCRFKALAVEREDNRVKLKNEAAIEMEGVQKPVLIAETLVLFYEKPR